MEYILAIEYVEEVIYKLKAQKEEITLKNLEDNLNILLNKNKEIIIAYAKVAFANIIQNTDKVTAKNMEAEIQNLKKLSNMNNIFIEQKYWYQLQTIFKNYCPNAEIWAYGSRINGNTHSGSDVDLIVKNFGDHKCNITELKKL